MIQSYNKKNYKDYEFACIKELQEKTNQIAVHWNHVSENMLIESGFLTSRYELRMKRKLTFELNGTYYNLLGEYGLDGLSIELINDVKVYHGIQCKYWKKKVPLSKLSTFIDVIDNRLHQKNNLSKGIIFSVKGVDNNTLNYFEEKNYYTSIKYNPQFDNIEKNIENQFLDTYDLNWNNNHVLRPYQNEAIQSLLLNGEWNGCKSLIMPCGTGKSVVFCNFLKEKRYKNIFIFSPLKVHARQNLERIKTYLPDYDYLLIDSESDGTRDIDEIKNKLNDTNKKNIFSSTFYSAKDIISQLFTDYEKEDDSEDEEDDGEEDNSEGYDDLEDEQLEFAPENRIDEQDNIESTDEDIYENNFDLNDSILIIDEAHNIIHEPLLIKLLERVPRTLLVTATPPEELEEVVNSEVIYKYTMSQAINDKNICDYEIFLPLIEYKDNKSEVLINIPDKLNELDHDLVKKGLFLINGMLKTGSRRCIVYLNSIDECNKYEKIFKDIMEKYHYIKLWIRQITTNTRDNERSIYLKEFEKDELVECKEDELKILLSIRILDEGVDIPRCDSVYLTHIGKYTSDIRVVQRICRANRLDNKNLNKKANCFLWTEDYHEIINNLQMLKENDLNFSSKIKMIESNYDEELNNVNIKNKEKELNIAFRDFINVKCLSYEELWEHKYNNYLKFIFENKRVPINNNDIEKVMVFWYCVQNKNFKEKVGLFKKDNIYNKWLYLQENFSEYLNDNKNRWLNKFYILKNYVEKNKKIPSKTENSSINYWVNEQNKKYKNNKIRHDCVEIWINFYNENLDLFKNMKTINELLDEQWYIKLNKVKIYIKTYNTKPSASKENKKNNHNLYLLARWLNKQNTNYNQNINNMSNENNRLVWSIFINEFSNQFLDKLSLWEIKLKKVIDYIELYGKRPPSNDPSENVKKLAYWINVQNGNYKKNKFFNNEYKKKWKEFLKEYNDIIFYR
jgi:superfamily II DNA or RNA helicase